MGANYSAAGYPSVFEFVRAVMASESNHLRAFVRFLRSTPAALKALQSRNWAGFAAAYNGRGYKANDYDTKLERAFEAVKAAAGQLDNLKSR
jgi:hypothetical protein